uniref:Uncharacterized protein n=1 Tax=Talaromyces marneffei PM1 TaxID=1077442 RepID=A0A093VGV8_TALMA
MLNEHSKVSIAQIAFYGPAVIAAVALLLFRRAVRTLPLFPWIVLLIFTLVSSYTDPVFSDECRTFIDFRKNKALAKIIICSRLLFLAGVAVLITGGCLQGSDSPDDQETGTKLVRIGYCIVTVFVACLLSFQLFFWSRKRYKIGYPEEHTTRIAGQAIELKT